MADLDYVIIDEKSQDYPDSLREISSKPKQLYCAGDISLLKEVSIAVVGSRKYTMYGKYVAELVGRTISNAGMPVVSGLAKGIDSFVHEATVTAGGRPIAVLGTGLNHIYPKSNAGLFEKIATDGLVISEYEPDFSGRPQSFPARNRIIAGLSSALVVIEANYKSGALITAQFALEQGKTIYSVPGNINSQFSMGTNLLIRDGATPLIVIDDILRDFGKKGLYTAEDEPELGGDEIEVYRIIKARNGITVDEISHILNKKSQEIGAILTILEIKGVASSFAGKVFAAK